MRTGPRSARCARSTAASSGAFEAWLLLRGMRTLYVRVPAACRAAQRIAERMAAHPRIGAVLYPGLPAAPGHAVAARQMQGGFGGMLSIRVRGGEAAAIATAARVAPVEARDLARRRREPDRAPRQHRGRRARPVPPDLLRLSVGIEDADDLIADLEQALEGNS